MDQWVKMHATKPDNLSLIPQVPGGGREPALTSCPLSGLHECTMVCMHSPKNNKNKLKYRNLNSRHLVTVPLRGPTGVFEV